MTVDIKDIIVPNAVNATLLNGRNADSFAQFSVVPQNFDFSNPNIANGIFRIALDATAASCSGLPEGAKAGIVISGKATDSGHCQQYIRHSDGKMFVKGSASSTKWQEVQSS